ncbi:MAG: hypothetical protein RLZZ225_302 [Pseudomonadota bacterium]|jgi:hypothetical protein
MDSGKCLRFKYNKEVIAYSKFRLIITIYGSIHANFN